MNSANQEQQQEYLRLENCPKETKNDRKFSLVQFKDDGILHICSNADIQYRRIKIREKPKVATCAKYLDGYFYRCKILCDDQSKSFLLHELQMLRKRAKQMENPPKKKLNKMMSYCLIQYLRTQDFHVVDENEILNYEFGVGIVQGEDGVDRRIQILGRGEKVNMFEKWKQVQEYIQTETPVKKKLRHPLLEFTPKVNVIKMEVEKKGLHVRNLLQAFQNEETSLQLPQNTNPNKDIVADVDYQKPSRSCDDSSLPTTNSDPESEEGEVEDPFSVTDEDTEYCPSTGTDESDDDSSEKDEEASDLQLVDAAYNFGGNAAFCGEPKVAETATTSSTNMSSVSSVYSSPVFFSEDSNDDVHLSDQNYCDDSLPVPRIKKGGKRNFSACIVCKQLRTRITRHLTKMHANHSLVAPILAIRDVSERKKAWKELRLQGNYRHNCGVLTKKSGNFLIQRHEKNGQPAPVDYLPCGTCKGIFKKNSMYKHVKRCNPNHKKYDRVQASSALLLPDEVAKIVIRGPGLDILRKIVYPRMKVDNITFTAKKDELIVKWGSFYCGKRLQKKAKMYLARVASQNMRVLARLVNTLKNLYGINSCLRNFLQPARFDDLIEAVSVTCGNKSGVFNSPSLPITLGHLLKTCAQIVYGEAARASNAKLVESIKAFLDLYEQEWSNLLTTRAFDQLKEERYTKRTTKLLPLAEDILIFSKYLKTEERAAVQALKKEFTYQTWARLGKILLCSLIVFNRKRVGDVQRITLESYFNKRDANTDSAIYQALNPEDKLMASAFMHMYTKGKKDSVVSVMLPKIQIQSFDLLIHLRRNANVKDDNEYLFGKVEGSYFDGCQALRHFSEKSGAKNHRLLRSTALRKHVATMSQVLNLKSGDLDVLAKFLGHNIDVHRQFYRLPDEALHLARISKLLTAVSSNEVEAIRGKSLDELPMPDNETTVEFLMRIENNANIDNENSISNLTERKIGSNDESHINNEIEDNIIAGSKNLKQIHRPWSNAEKEAVFRHFSVHIQEGKAPGKYDVLDCLESEPALSSRSWKNVKDFVRNYSKSALRNKNPV